MASFLERLRNWHCLLPSICILTWCLLTSGHLVAGEEDFINMDDYLKSIESKQHSAAGQQEWKVRKQRDLADTVASLGKLLRYHIPTEAFCGEINQYQVKEASGDNLPKWLYFNDDAATLEGIPTSQDVGQLHVNVIAIGSPSPSGKPNSAQNSFSIEVLPTGQDLSPLHCDFAEEVTMLTINLDGDLNTMDAVDRVRLANRTMKYFLISEEELRMVPIEDGEEMSNDIFMIGRGNALETQSVGLRLQWLVGCSDQDSSSYEAVITSLEPACSDGNLTEILGLPVINWHLRVIKPLFSRQKRQQPIFDNHNATNGSTINHHENHEVHETFPEIPVSGTEKTEEQLSAENNPLSELHILPTLSSTFNFVGTSTFLPEKPLLTAMPTNQDIKVTPALSTFMASIVMTRVEPTIVEHEVSTEMLLQPSMVQSILTGTELLTHVTSYQPTYTTFTAMETSVIPTSTTTQLPPSLPAWLEKPSYNLEFVVGHVSRFSLMQGNFTIPTGFDNGAMNLSLSKADGTALPDSTWIQVDSSKQEIYALPLGSDVGSWIFVLRVGSSGWHLVHAVVLENPNLSPVHHEFVMSVKYDVSRYRFSVEWQTKLAKKLTSFFGDLDERNILVRNVTMNPGIFTWTNTSLPAYPCPLDTINQLLASMAYKGETISTLPLRNATLPEFRLSKVSVNLVGVCKPEPEPSPTLPIKTLPNEKPQVRNHIDLINATQGRMLRFVVPPDTFFDEEDGDTRNLSLRFLAINGLDVAETSWIQFLAPIQEFRGLPMASDVGSLQYQLIATNRRNVSVADAFIVTVVEPASTKPPSVEFSLHFNSSFHNFDNRPKHKFKVLYLLARLYKDVDPRYITVRNVASGSVAFIIWTNSTLPSHPCPVASIGELVRVLFNPDGTVSKKLLNMFSENNYTIIDAEVIPGGVCLADVTPTKIRMGPSSTVEVDHAYTDDDIYVTTIVPAVVIAAMLVVAAIVTCVLYRNKRKGDVPTEEDSPFVGKGIPIIFTEELEDRPAPARTSREGKPLLPPPKYPQSSGSGASSPPAEQEHDSSSEAGSEPDDDVENSPRYQPPPPLTSNVEKGVNRPKHTPNYRLPPPYVPP